MHINISFFTSTLTILSVFLHYLSILIFLYTAAAACLDCRHSIDKEKQGLPYALFEISARMIFDKLSLLFLVRFFHFFFGCLNVHCLLIYKVKFLKKFIHQIVFPCFSTGDFTLFSPGETFA